MNTIIVSRHPAAVQFIRETAGLDETIPVFAEVKAEDVAGKIVYGNLPLHLACLCETVYAVEFEGAPPRGQEYSADDMKSAGAKLTPYRVVKV